MHLAAVDVGTNTVRLLVAEVHGAGQWKPVHRGRVVTRLGEGLAAHGVLQESAMARTLAALETFREEMNSNGVGRVAAVGTSALREAGNGEVFLSRIRESTGLTVEVISGQEEAELSVKGVWQTLIPVLEHQGQNRPCDLLMVDIGGGSTEVALCRHGKALWMESLPVGVVRLTEEYLRPDPPSGQALDAMEKAIGTHLIPLAGRFFQYAQDKPQVSGGSCLVGTAGTMTTLGAMDLGLASYEPERLHGYRLAEDSVAHLYQTLCGMPAASRLAMPGLEPGREDVIVAGAAIILACMRVFGYPEVVVSEGGLLEGILFREMEQATVSSSGFKVPGS